MMDTAAWAQKSCGYGEMSPGAEARFGSKFHRPLELRQRVTAIIERATD